MERKHNLYFYREGLFSRGKLFQTKEFIIQRKTDFLSVLLTIKEFYISFFHWISNEKTKGIFTMLTLENPE